MIMPRRNPRVLAIASGGGHWVQLLRLRPAFEGCDVTYATTHRSYRDEVPGERFHVVPDSNRRAKFRLVLTSLAVARLLLMVRPEVVVSTGAAPGYFAVRLGRWFGARTIWLDSVANAEALSLAGCKAGRCVDLWLTQWPQLARHGGPFYRGSVL